TTVPTVLPSGTIVPVITHPRGRMRVVPRSRTATVPPALLKRTTQGPGRLPLLFKGPMPMGAMEPRRFRKTVTPPTASIKRPLKEPQVRCTLRTAVRLMVRQVSTAIALLWVRPPMATSMRPRTATSIATPGAAGAEIRTIRSRRAPRLTPVKVRQAIRAAPRNPAHQAGADRKGVADQRHSVEAAEVAGNPGRQVRAVQQAGAAAVDK